MTYSNHLLKLEIMVAISSLFVILIWQPRVRPATTARFVTSEIAAVPKNRKITMFSSFDLTFVTPPFTYVFPYTTWVPIQFQG